MCHQFLLEVTLHSPETASVRKPLRSCLGGKMSSVNQRISIFPHLMPWQRIDYPDGRAFFMGLNVRSIDLSRSLASCGGRHARGSWLLCISIVWFPRKMSEAQSGLVRAPVEISELPGLPTPFRRHPHRNPIDHSTQLCRAGSNLFRFRVHISRGLKVFAFRHRCDRPLTASSSDTAGPRR